MDLSNPAFIKDLVYTAFSSELIMSALEACFKRCTYNGLRIDANTFEPEEARQDYFITCKEVLIEQLRPFAPALFIYVLNKGIAEEGRVKVQSNESDLLVFRLVSCGYGSLKEVKK